MIVNVRILDFTIPINIIDYDIDEQGYIRSEDIIWRALSGNAMVNAFIHMFSEPNMRVRKQLPAAIRDYLRAEDETRESFIVTEEEISGGWLAEIEPDEHL